MLQLIYNSVNFTKSPKSVDLFQHREAKLSLFVNFLHVCFLYFMTTKWVNQEIFSSQEKVIFTIILLTFSILKFKEQALQNYYVNPFSQKIGTKFFLSELNLGIIAFSFAVSDLDLIVQNLPYILLNMTFLSNMSLNTYLRQRRTHMYLSRSSEIKGENQAMLYLECLG